MKKKFFKYNADAKVFAKKKNGKIRPVFEIGPMNGKNFKGYNVEYK